MSEALLVSQRPYLVAPEPPADIHTHLVRDLEEVYARITDLRDAELTDVWLLARDIVLSLEKWSAPLLGLPGPTKMDIALDVAWEFLDGRGGMVAIRERLLSHLPLPGFIGRWLVARLVNRSLARQLVRFVLELAVREMKKVRAHPRGAQA